MKRLIVMAVLAFAACMGTPPQRHDAPPNDMQCPTGWLLAPGGEWKCLAAYDEDVERMWATIIACEFLSRRDRADLCDRQDEAIDSAL